MPVDADGNVADLITSPDSVPGRMNLGRLYGPYFTCAARDVHRQMLEELGHSRHRKDKFSIEEYLSTPQHLRDTAIATLLKFYSIVSRRSYREFTEVLTSDERDAWMLHILNDGITIYFCIEDDEDGRGEGRRLFYDEMVAEIEKNFKLTYGPVSYVGRSGERVTTLNNFRISPLYIMPLDKTADTFLAVDIGKHSNFGILAAMNETDKFSAPWHRTPPKTNGETEARLYNMHGSRELIAELLDRSGAIDSQYECAKRIVHAEHPTNIDKIIDRKELPFGNSRANQIAHHTFRCMGFDVVYEPEDI